METVALILLLILGLLLVAVVLALALPLRVWLAFDTGAERKLSVRMQPFGRFGPRFPVAGGADRPEKKKPKRKKPRKAQSWRGLRVIGWPDVRRALAGVIAAIHLEDIRLDAAFGLGDPAETGHVFGLLAPVIYGGAGCSRAHLNLRPVFDRACLSGEGHLQWRMRPIAVLWPLARLGWTVVRGRR